jgi:hypothetical protein
LPWLPVAQITVELGLCVTAEFGLYALSDYRVSLEKRVNIMAARHMTSLGW